MKNLALFLFLIVGIGLMSCKKDNKKSVAQAIVTEWMDKTIILPSNISCSFMGQDTVCPDIAQTPYKILAYTDSTGCTSCKLKLSAWKHFIAEADSLMPAQVEFLFYFHPKSEKELSFLLKRDLFEHIIYIDKENEINKQNNFAKEMEFQCFLLDSNNKVVSIGNPTLNPKVWNLYKQIIKGDPKEKKESLTTIRIDKTEIELQNLKAGKKSMTSFIIKNTGNQPLLISHVDASCGCTVPSWEKNPVKPNDETEIKVEVTPDNAGYFKKNISVFCNIENSSIALTVKGDVRE